MLYKIALRYLAKLTLNVSKKEYKKRVKKQLIIAAISSFLIILGSFIVFSNSQPLNHPSVLVSGLSLMTLGYLLALFSPQSSITQNFLMISSSISIILFVLMPPFFNDFYRYLWDGKIVANLMNPYATSPDLIANNPVTAHLSDVWYWKDLFFKWSHSIYGPTLMIVFGLSNLISMDSGLIMKIVFAIFAVLSLLLISKILKGKKLPQRRILLVALSPLFLFEVFAASHVESIYAFFLLLCLYLFEKNKKVLSSVSLAFATLTKFFPLVFLPFFVIKKHRNIFKIKKGSIKFVIIFAITIILLYLPFYLTTEPELLFKSFNTFRDKWVMSPGIFALFKNFFSILNLDGYSLAKTVTNVTTILLIVYSYIRYKKHGDLYQSLYEVSLWLIILSSVVFSWYVLWLVILLPFIKNPWPALTLSITILSQYLLIYFDKNVDLTFKYLDNGEILWSQLLIWIPPLVVLLITNHPKIRKKYE